MPFRTIDDSNYVHGVNKEILAFELPPGALADASNMLFDVPGIARQRNGSTALSALGAVAAAVNNLGWSFWQDSSGNVTEELFGVNGKTGDLMWINKATGAQTLISTYFNATQTQGRPIRHQGTIIFPSSELNIFARRAIYSNGQTSTTTFTTAATSAITAGNPTITLSGADNTTNIKVGACVTMFDATNQYSGRVISITDATHFKVFPAPGWTNAAIPIGQLQFLPLFGSVSSATGSCGCTFQNRLLFGNAQDRQNLIWQRRITYSPLLAEPFFQHGTGTINEWGGTYQVPGFWPELNYVDVPGVEPIIALEPVSDNELFILTSGTPWIFTGQLATQTSVTAPGITFDLSPMNVNADCLSDLSVQRTPHGIVWASSEGIMLYTGGGRQPLDLTAGKYHTAWRNLTQGSSFAVHGSFYARNHYVVSGISGGTTFALAFNMDNQTWSPLSGVGTDIFFGAPRPTAVQQTWVARWWDISGAAPNMTNGQVLRAETLFAPDVVGQTKLDADGAVVPFSLTTRTMTDDVQSQRFLRRVASRYAATHTAFANVTVAAGSRVDAADSAGTPTVAIGNLSNTSVLTISGQSNATPIVITTSVNHGLQSGDEVDIRGVTTNSNANGHWQITVISVTTFSLNGSVGNGATTATGTCHKVTEQELDASAADPGQGNYLVVASAGTVNKFEWHGARLGVMEMLRGMAR